MGFKGTEFYDDNRVFELYMQLRKKADNANDTVEKPITLDMLGDVREANVLDLGCGDGAFGLELLKKGAQSYLGLEGSQNMYQKALINLQQLPQLPQLHQLHQSTQSPRLSYQVILTNIEEWDYPAEMFDLVVSRLVLHYIDDLESLFQKVRSTLKKGGKFVFSVEHPVNVACNTDDRSGWTVADYFRSGRRVSTWLGQERVTYHRTIEEYFSILQKAGFEVASLRESKPERENFSTEEKYANYLQFPLFLFLTGKVGN